VKGENMMSYLDKIVNGLAKQEQLNKAIFNYVIPDLWDSADVKVDKIDVKNGNLIVNPYQFFQTLIKDEFLVNNKKKTDFSKPYYLGQPKNRIKGLKNGDWIRQSFAYSMMIRSSASYDHDRSGRLEEFNLYNLKETGTFVKALAYLPLLKKMGVDVVYMLPISKYSLKDKKGELGSPYGVSNFFKLDEGLKDPMTGPDCTVEDEFRAFVEACHRLDMKVIIDIIPRTNSVNSDLIIDHPDWFYWIKLEDLSDYASPYVPGLKAALPAKKEYFEQVFASEEVIDHIKKFKPNPKDTNPDLWKKLVKKWKDGHGKYEVLDLVQQMFDLTIAPAFSDCINDPQPAWSDVTFFRLYLDHPANSAPYLEDLGEIHPYILFDVAKSSLNPGTIKNMELWNTLADIIPFFQREFGIDGARIDMGHALPDELINMILTKAREIDPNFCFIAEELDVENAKISKEKGYNMIIGDGFIRLPRVQEGLFNSFVYGAMNLESPLFSVGETHDTPRLAARDGGETLGKMVSVFNLFVPNTIPFLNSGQEVYERQPMNTGLDCRPNELFMLENDDPYYGKLALFDRYAFHYNHKHRWEIPRLLENVSSIRKDYIDAMMDMDNVYPLGFSAPWDTAAGFGYVKDDKVLIAITNTDMHNEKYHYVKLDNLPEHFFAQEKTIIQLFSSEDNSPVELFINEYRGLNIHFVPGEVKLLEIR